MKRSTFLSLLTGSLLLPLVWGLVIEPASLHNETYTLTLPAWPPTCDGLRIAVLSDLHTGSPYHGLDTLDAIVALTQQSRPDVVLLAGDYVITGVAGGTVVAPEAIAERLARLVPPLGVYAVLGNHDWWFGAERVRTAFQSAGIPVLEDAATPLVRGQCRFWVVGIGDYWEGRHDLDRALADVTDDAPAIAFTHNPDVFPMVPARVALTIAGHTHGGQVALPLVGRPIVPSRYGERYAKGLVVEEGRHLFVSTGLGTSVIPVRFRVPPEVSVLVLRSP